MSVVRSFPSVTAGASLVLALALTAGSAGLAGAQSAGGKNTGTDGAGSVPRTSVGVDAAGGEAQPAPPAGTGGLGWLLGQVGLGGPTIDGGSSGLRAVGSGELADAGLSVATTIGSVGPLASLGSTNGSATASVASSGLIPGLAYTNATGSIGSGTFTVLGSVTVPEYAIGVGALNLAGGYVAVLAEKQERGKLSPEEIRFWHSVVVGSAGAAGTLEDAATASGAQLPEVISGSIDSVRAAAAEDPTAGGAATDEDTTAGAESTGGTPAEEAATSGARTPGIPAAAGRAGSPSGASEPDHPASAAVATSAGTGHTLAATGVDAPRILVASVVLLLLGSIALGAARRRS